MVRSKFLLKFKKVKHYFFDRDDSLNLEGYQIKTDCCISAEQIHGGRVVLVTSNKHPYLKNCDGMITKKNLFLNIKTADCLPIFFYDPKKTIIAAIHAGWKGLYLGIIQNAIKKMEKLGSQPKDIIAAMGPHIKVCCYNVSLRRVEMLKRRKNNFFPDIGIFRNFLWYLNLEKIAQQQMADLGILKRNIDILPFCTSCDKRFFSARRDGILTGRMFNVIGLTT